ncbi:carbonic anhydrase, putative [Plasmodium vinckei brucechwatti]|uniref:Carbonic anhydrase, putative n=1 Tax=Plasmodium vinckei brucechwatti TaxID=119398 RepID=A0A6V7S6X6_PLAVN|nr:carbonic anhydrase, putative [Plasmodium vinckei brucechwatti]
MKNIIFLSIVFCFCDNVVYNNYVGRILFELPDNIMYDLNSGPIVEYEIKEHKDDNPDINKEVKHWNVETNEHKDNPNIQRSNESNDDSNKNWQYHSNYNDEQSESQNENERNEFSLKNEAEKNPEERKDTQFDKYNEYNDFENMNNNFEENKKKYFEAMQSEDMEDKKGEENKDYIGWVEDKQREENRDYIDGVEDKNNASNREYTDGMEDKNSAGNREYTDGMEDKNSASIREYTDGMEDKNSARNREYIDGTEDKKREENKDYIGWVEDKNSAGNREYAGWMDDKQIEDHRNEENNIKSDTTQHNDNLSFDYSKQGMDWAAGICKNGKYQSPVDLHMHTLKERELKNLSDFYLNAFYDNDEYSWNNYNRPWFKGDIFYYYENLINKIIINRQNNMFKIKASNNEIIPFGVLFTTDEPAIFYSHHINFHSPSEHTFEGSGNRRHIEMQIYHSTNEIYDYDESKWNGIFGKKKNQKKNNETNIKHSYILTFLRNSLSNPRLGHQNPKNKKRNKRSKSYNNNQLGRNGKNTKRLNQYQVISITFSSAEINKSTINNFKKLPSEKFLKTILEGTQNVPVGSDPTLVDLKAPLNLNSVLMMLNMKSMEFFAYHGSSTSPDCNENVHWKVAKKSLPISTETMLKFYNMLKKTTPDYNGSDNDNFRALQNVQGNIHNYGRVYLIQGFPVQLLISSILTTSEDKTVIENIKQAYSKSNGNYICFNFIFLLFIFMFLQNY